MDCYGGIKTRSRDQRRTAVVCSESGPLPATISSRKLLGQALSRSSGIAIIRWPER